jgi:hypothetical protein
MIGRASLCATIELTRGGNRSVGQAPNNRLYEDNKAIFKEALDSFKLVKYGE